MIPTALTTALPDLTQTPVVTAPGYTYHLDLQSKRILGKIDGIEAVKQMIYKTLHTERYAWAIYDWSYGMELEQYIGADYDFIAADMGLCIAEALMVDDRILEVSGFVFRKNAIDILQVDFQVKTTEGDMPIQLGVRL